MFSFVLFLGRQHFENSLHGKQLKIAQKRVAQWETAVKVAEKAKPMNRHERQLCYTFKYYDKNEGKRLDPLKMKKLNGFASLPEQVNGLVDGHANGTSDLSQTETAVPELKVLNGVAHNCTNGSKDDQKKVGKVRVQRKRKLTALAAAAKAVPNDIEAPKSAEPPKKKKKRTSKQNNNLNSSGHSDEGTEKGDLPIKVNLSDKHHLNASELHEKCNGLFNSAGASTPPRINGDIASLGANMEVSPNTALKMKIRKITPKQNQQEGKRKRGRPRKPQFVIVSEEEKDMSNVETCQTLCTDSALTNDVESEKKLDGVSQLPLSPKATNDESPLKKKRVRKPSSKALSSKEVAVLRIKEAPAVKVKRTLETKTKKEEEKKKEVSEVNGTVENEGSVAGSVTSSSIGDETGSLKNGAASKKEKEAVCIVCEQQENLIFCEGICGNAFHLDCIGLSVVPKGKFICDECVTGNHCCFVCRQTGNVKQCSQQMCTKHYHEDCVKTFKSTKFDGDRFYCPLHFCSTCIRNKSSVSRGRLIRCVRCPTAYHLSGCLVAGCIQISSHLMVCSKHFLREKNKAHHTHVNVNWCFVCSIGGTLICCESCPAAFHPECISYEGIPEGHFFCKDCTEGKEVLYSEIVWVKLGMYRYGIDDTSLRVLLLLLLLFFRGCDTTDNFNLSLLQFSFSFCFIHSVLEVQNLTKIQRKIKF